MAVVALPPELIGAECILIQAVPPIQSPQLADLLRGEIEITQTSMLDQTSRAMKQRIHLCDLIAGGSTANVSFMKELLPLQTPTQQVTSRFGLQASHRDLLA